LQLADTFDPAEIRKLREKERREARLAVALYDSHAMAVRQANERLTAVWQLMRHDARLPPLRATLSALLATVSAAEPLTSPLPSPLPESASSSPSETRK
jgi:hypothetical protein